MLEYVAVEHVELLALETMREVHGPPHRLSRPYENGVLEAQVGRRSAALIPAGDAVAVGSVLLGFILVSILSLPCPDAVHLFGSKWTVAVLNGYVMNRMAAPSRRSTTTQNSAYER